MQNIFKWLYSCGWHVKEGWYLRYGNVGWEWLPTDTRLDEMIKNGEIG